MFISISIVVIALAIVAFVGYAIRTMHSAGASMKQFNETLTAMQKQLEETGRETVILMQTTHRVTQDIETKLTALDALFSSAGQVGEAVQEVTRSVRQVSATVSQSVTDVQKAVHQNQRKLKDVIEWATTGIQLWQVWQAHRQEKSGAKKVSKLNKGDEENVG